MVQQDHYAAGVTAASLQAPPRQANGSIRSIPIPTDGSLASASPLHQSASPRDTPAELATSSRHVRQKRGSHVTQQRLPAPADGLSDAAPSSDGDASPDGDSGSKPRSQKAQRPAFSVSAVAFADDPADSRPGSAPSSPVSAPGFDIYIRSHAGSTRSGDDAADTLSASLQSLSAPSHLSNESQTALAQEAALTPALQNSLASLSRSPAGGSRLMPSALYRAPGGLGSHSSQAGSPALSQAGDEPHRDGPPDQPEEEEELSLAALPLKRPAPDHSSGSVGTGEDSSEVTFGAGVGGGGGGAESRLRPVPVDPVDEGLEAQSAPLPAQLPPADAPSQQVPAPVGSSQATSGASSPHGLSRRGSSDLDGSASGSGVDHATQDAVLSSSPASGTAQALELARLRLSTDTPPVQLAAPPSSSMPIGRDPGREASFTAGRDSFRIGASHSSGSGTSPAEHSDTSMSPTAPAGSPLASREPPASPPGRRLYHPRHVAAPGARRTASDLDVRTATIKSAAAAGGPASLLSAALQQPRGSRLSSAQSDRPQANGAILGAPLANGALTQPQEQPGPVGAPAAVDAEQRLRLARVLLSRGKTAAALQLAETLLPLLPADPALLCLRGQCLAAIGNNVGAFACFASALNLAPDHAETLIACGTLYKNCGLLVEAVESYKLALKGTPDDMALREALAVALTDLGTKLKTAGNVGEGMARYLEAVVVCPTYAAAFYNQGVVHSEHGRLDAATASYRRAVELLPAYAEAWCNLGVILRSQGKLNEAVEAYDKAQAAAPNFAIVHTNLAIALTEMGTKLKMAGDLPGGIKLYERALAHNAQHADAWYNMGVAWVEAGDLHRAIYCYELAVHFNPHCAEAHNNLGVIHRDMGNLEHAAQCYLAALQIRPNFPQGLNNLAVIYTAQGKAQEALQTLQAATLADPGYAEAYNNLGVLQRDVGAMADALAAYDKCLELTPDSRNAGQNKLLALNYMYPGEDPKVCVAHAAWGEAFEAGHTPLPPRVLCDADQEPDRRLTVGYVSPDLFTHSVSYFAEAPLRHHRKDTVRLIVYNCVPKADAKTELLRKAVEDGGGTWRDVTALPERELAALVREDGVDVLVELTGHTAHNRLGVMALRPAPVQVTWIGYPNTTGLRAVDYRFTDELCDPPDTAQTFVEELVRLRSCFLCYTPVVAPPPVTPLPAAENGFVTFGSFNALAKITQEVIRVWARILEALPTARLLLKNKPFACESARAHTLGLLAAEGVSADRVDLLPLAPATVDHLATYGVMDISLDPWPYAGTTTTCESLFMGVPCITLAGGCHAHNVGVSLLTTVGLGEQWVARSIDEYVQLALRAAADTQGLGKVRSTLRERMLASPLCDSKRFVKQLEGVYDGLWRRWRDSQAADKQS